MQCQQQAWPTQPLTENFVCIQPNFITYDIAQESGIDTAIKKVLEGAVN